MSQLSWQRTRPVMHKTASQGDTGQGHVRRGTRDIIPQLSCLQRMRESSGSAKEITRKCAELPFWVECTAMPIGLLIHKCAIVLVCSCNVPESWRSVWGWWNAATALWVRWPKRGLLLRCARLVFPVFDIAFAVPRILCAAHGLGCYRKTTPVLLSFADRLRFVRAQRTVVPASNMQPQRRSTQAPV